MTQGCHKNKPPDAGTSGGGTVQVFAGCVSLHLNYTTLPLFDLLDKIETNQAEIRRLNTIDHLMLGDYAIVPAWHGDINPLPHNDDWWILYKQLTIATTHDLYAAGHWILNTLERMCSHD